MLPILLLAATAAPQALQGPGQDVQDAKPIPQSLIEVEVDQDRLGALLALDLDIPHIHGDAGHAQIIADSADLNTLRAAGISFSVLVDDLEAWYAARLAPGSSSLTAGSGYGMGLNPPFSQGAMGGYWTFSQVTSILDQLTAANPSIVSAKQSLGTTIQGRDIWMIKVSDNPNIDEAEPEVRFDSLHHAREPQGMQTSLYFLSYLIEEYGSDPMATYLVNEREMFFVPVVNPDGYVYNQQQSPNGGGLWRKNRRNNGGGSFGVDLNRNYPYQWGFDSVGSSGNTSSETYRGTGPASEPETQAMVNFIQSRNFKTALSIHTFSNLWISPWGYDEIYPNNYAQFEEIGELATEFNGYIHAPAWVTLYTANGVTNDYDFNAKGTLSWTPEIGNSSDGFWPLQSRIVPLAEENLVAFQRTALAAGPWLRVEDVAVLPQGDGDAFPEAGEEVQFGIGLRNSGLAPTGAISASLSTTSPFATVTSGATSAPSLGNFSSVNLSPNLALEIAPGTPAGTLIEAVLSLSHGSRNLDEIVSIEVGEPTIVAAYDFEAGGAQGWTLGTPSTASTGEWTRVNPIGTAAQPEDDHTAAGSRCWVTGQGSQGGSLGENDVDGGTTTLLSPSFDVSALSNVRVRYWQWYSNNTGSAADDIFEVDISSNGGSTWVSALVVGPQGAGTSGGWTEVTLNVEDYVPLTSQLRLRFLASDLGQGSIVEAGIDDLEVSGFPDGCPAPTNYCVTTPNSFGPGALISAGGSQLISDNAFSLSVSGSVPNQFGIFFYGPLQDSAPAGNGIRCVGGGLFRLPPVQADSLGNAAYALDFTNPPGPGSDILAGSTWNFSWWYRDPSLGAGFDFSDGVSAQFCD